MYNVIPNEVTISGCTRCFSPKVQAKLEQQMRKIAEDICNAYGATSKFFYERRYPPTINSEIEANLAGQVAVGIVGADRVNLSPKPAMGSEDFAYFTEACPGAIMRFGCGNEEKMPFYPLHSPYFDIDEQVLGVGVEVFTKAVLSYLEA